ncbi:MAG: PIG-L family deacetylase [bacterium]
MKFLFVYAHPDDETFGAGGTIHRLVLEGHDVFTITATDGSAGSILNRNKKKFEGKDIKTIRRSEYKNATTILQVGKSKILDFDDGQMNNSHIWGKLTNTIKNIIEGYKPDVVVTFENTGWYYHLDHIAVFVAVNKAVLLSSYKVKALLYNHFSALDYCQNIYTNPLEKKNITHTVNVSQLKNVKISAMVKHESQIDDNALVFIDKIKENDHIEEFELAYSTIPGEGILEDSGIFDKIS